MVRRAAVLAVALAAPLCLCGPQVDPVHKLMEPPPPKVERPRVKSPVVAGPRLHAPGLAGLLGRLASPSKALLLLPAAIVGLALTFPEPMARLALHVLCFLGSLFEPFNDVLPQKHPLKFFVQQVQHARRAYEVKHGLEGLRSPMQFFDDDDHTEVDDDEADDDEGADEGADGAEAESEAEGEASEGAE